MRGIATGYEIQIDLVKAISLHEFKIDHVAHLGPSAAAGIGTLLGLDVETIFQAVGQALNNISIALAKVSAVRGEAGTMMQNAQTITTNNGNLTIQEQTDQSNAENVNMVQTISEFQSQQTAYQAALASYAQIQKLSLFNYISS